MAKVSFDLSRLERKIDSAFYAAVRSTKKAAADEAAAFSKDIPRAIHYREIGKRRVILTGSRRPARRYWAAQEIGARPHVIEPKRGKVLRFFKDGQAIFTRRVQHHPGVKPRRYLRKAVDRTFVNAFMLELRSRFSGGGS